MRRTNSINIGNWVALGGVEQWVTIRGHDCRNPILLVLHGGPGAPMSRYSMALSRWEQAFTVVNWDQRGAGRTFVRHGRNGSAELTVARMTADGLALTEELATRFPQTPVVLLGVSWGSLLGVEMVRRRPDLFTAFVGTGQFIDGRRGESLSYYAVLERLKQQHRQGAADALKALGPPPYPDRARSLKALGQQRRLLRATMPARERQVWRRIVPSLLLTPGLRLSDLTSLKASARSSMWRLWDEMIGWRLEDGGLTFEVPLVFLQGELDLHTPTQLVADVFPNIRAPTKALEVIDGAAHAVCLTHHEQFLRHLIRYATPSR